MAADIEGNNTCHQSWWCMQAGGHTIPHTSLSNWPAAGEHMDVDQAGPESTALFAEKLVGTVELQ